MKPLPLEQFEELMPSSNSALRDRSNALSVRVRWRTARADAIPKLTL